jgi:hypothetical protein
MSAVPPTVIAKVRNGLRATGERLPGIGWVRRAHWFLGEHPGDPRAICRGPLGRSVNSQHYLACPESVLFGPAVPRHDAPVGRMVRVSSASVMMFARMARINQWSAWKVPVHDARKRPRELHSRCHQRLSRRVLEVICGRPHLARKSRRSRLSRRD